MHGDRKKMIWWAGLPVVLLALTGPPAYAASSSSSCKGIEAAQVYPFDKPALSRDGSLVAFTTAASLAPRDTNGTLDVYVWSARDGVIELVSAQGAGGGRYPTITPDGRFVAFQSDAQLLAGDRDGPATDVFVYDRRSAVTDHVSVGLAGGATMGESSRPAISANGRFIAFRSTSDDLVRKDKNKTVDVFVRDRRRGTTIRVSVASDGTEGDDRSAGRSRGGLDISDDGRYVVFESAATTLVADDPNFDSDIFIHDLRTHETKLVSVAQGGGDQESSPTSLLGANSLSPSVSADGRFVAFDSTATNLVEDDDNNQGPGGGVPTDVFVRDMVEGKTERVSVSTEGAEADGPSHFPSISADGRFVSFESAATNFAAGDDNGEYDVFLHDRVEGSTSRVSVGSGRPEGGSALRFPLGSVSSALSPDGRVLAFASDASGLAPRDTNGAFDIFVRRLQKSDGFTRLATPCGGGSSAASRAASGAAGARSPGGPGPARQQGAEVLLISLGLAIPLVLVWGSRRTGAVFAEIVAAALVLGSVGLPPADAHHYSPIQPGGQINPEEAPCSMNFVFRDERGDLFIGTAAHCIRELGTDGVVGARTVIEGVGEFGTTVYGRYEFWSSRALDYSLIKIDRDKRQLVDPSLRAWGGPTGVETEFTPGTGTRQYGFGVFLRNTEATRAKTGVLSHVEEGAGPYEGWYVEYRAVAGGDSGSAVVTDDGRALGITVAVAPGWGELGTQLGPTAELILEDLRLAGFDLELVTAPFPADPARTIEHCVRRPIDESGRGDGCIRASPGP